MNPFLNPIQDKKRVQKGVHCELMRILHFFKQKRKKANSNIATIALVHCAHVCCERMLSELCIKLAMVTCIASEYSVITQMLETPS